jgi:hypothetical protein
MPAAALHPDVPPASCRAPLLLARALLLVVALLAGCATAPPAERPREVPPPLTVRPDVEPNFLVPSRRERMIVLATQEWSLFGQPIVTYDAAGAPIVTFLGTTAHEVQPAMLTRVLMYWYGVNRAPIVGPEGELRAWSAAFIAWLARSAGYTRDEFPDTVRHWDYISRFANADGKAPFVARDPARYAPRIGDLVCNARGAVVEFASLQPGGYHCDIVVFADGDAIESIGGNVSDVVARSRLPVDALGLLMPLPDRPWAAVLELVGP